jgi:hypothetical protein
MRYNVRWAKERTWWYAIVAIWIISGSLFVPYFVYYEDVGFNVTLVAIHPSNESIPEILIAHVCISMFTSVIVERILFLVVNLLIAFLIPLMVITVLYAFILNSMSNYQSVAVDAVRRDHRTRIRITQMMLTVVVMFAVSWLPLYGKLSSGSMGCNVRKSTRFRFPAVT